MLLAVLVPTRRKQHLQVLPVDSHTKCLVASYHQSTIKGKVYKSTYLFKALMNSC